MQIDDQEYLERRAEQELELAQRADNPTVVRAHYVLLGFYLDRLHGPDTAPGAIA